MSLARVCAVLFLAIGLFDSLEVCAAEEEPAFIQNPRQLIYEGVRSGEGYFSPDGQTMVFQAEREPSNPFFQIYKLDLITGEVDRISPGIGKTTCAFYRPGRGDILFGSTHHDPQAETKMQAELDFRASGQSRRYSWDYDHTMDIFVAPAGSTEGGDLLQLTDAPGYDAEAAYSPDGELIVFTSLRSAYPLEKLSDEDRKRYEIDPASFGEIYTMRADGSEVTRLTEVDGYDGGPFFSANGKRIIWRRFDEKGVTADVYTMKVDGTDVRQLTDFDSMSWAPYFHPSGDYAVFASNKHGFSNFELFVVDALGEKEPVRVTQTDGFDGLPVFSPDGNKLSWTSGRTSNGKSQIFIGDWNDAKAREALASAPPRTSDARPAEEFHAGHGPMCVGHAHDQRRAEGTLSPEDALRADVAFLADDALEGRLTGSSGAAEAARYLSDRLANLGFQPLSPDGFFDPFEFGSGVTLDESGTSLGFGGHTLSLNEGFAPYAFSGSGSVTGPIVFAGYGLRTPDGGADGYDAYAGLDVAGKIVLILRFSPEDVEADRRSTLNRHASLRYKALIAKERGAVGVIVVHGPNSPGEDELPALELERMGSAGLPVVRVRRETALAWFEAAGVDLAAVQGRLDIEDPHAMVGQTLAESAKLSVKLDRQMSTGRNIVAALPPVTSEADQAEYVMVGGHYDHLGRGQVGSLAANPNGEIHNGADDNASGVAVSLAIAEAIAEKRAADPSSMKRGLIVALWSGEELGLLGASDFVKDPIVPLDRVVAYLNFDMVGRLRENTLILQGSGSSSVWPRLIEKRNIAAGFALRVQPDPFLPTDATALYGGGVPVMNFFTGAHDDYHRPADDAHLLNYEGMDRIAVFATGIAADLMSAEQRPDYLRVESSATNMRGSLRVYLGTIPDYAADIEGLRLSGVRPGGPAEAAGMQEGDVLIEFAGRAITDIYDFTYALDGVKPDVTVDAVVRRGDEEVTLAVTPTLRK
ncbi:MAG: M28 family peptidase [Planctomycetota bacterium]